MARDFDRGCLVDSSKLSNREVTFFTETPYTKIGLNLIDRLVPHGRLDNRDRREHCMAHAERVSARDPRCDLTGEKHGLTSFLISKKVKKIETVKEQPNFQSQDNAAWTGLAANLLRAKFPGKAPVTRTSSQVAPDQAKLKETNR